MIIEFESTSYITIASTFDVIVITSLLHLKMKLWLGKFHTEYVFNTEYSLANTKISNFLKMRVSKA